MLTRNGRDGLHMLPELAAVMPGRLRAAIQGSASGRIRHKRVGLFTTYATLDHAAASSLADQIAAVYVP